MYASSVIFMLISLDVYIGLISVHDSLRHSQKFAHMFFVIVADVINLGEIPWRDSTSWGKK